MRREELGSSLGTAVLGSPEAHRLWTMVKCAQCGPLVEQEPEAERCLTHTVFSK